MKREEGALPLGKRKGEYGIGANGEERVLSYPPLLERRLIPPKSGGQKERGNNQYC